MIFTNLSNNAQQNDIKSSMQRGDWLNISAIMSLDSQTIIDIVKESRLQGRSGAGFLTGVKWNFVPKIPSKPHYLVINADEGEPGTCKDRAIMRSEPHKIIEGALIAAKAIKAEICYIYIRKEYFEEAKILQHAIDECYEYGFIGKNCFGINLDIYIHKGAGAYICGEESALLSSIEGFKGFPRLKPPFPCISGLYGCPTVVNNVETIANIPTILKRGADWFKQISLSTNSSGTKVFSISGHVNNPCVFEEKMGVSLRYLIDHYGKGVVGGWENLNAIIPGGSSTPLIPFDECDDIVMDFECLKAHGSLLGTGGIIVVNKSINMIDVIANFAKFYMHESCGQCSPCREGMGWLFMLIQKLRKGQDESSALIEEVALQIEGKTICGLSDACVWMIKGFLKHRKKYMK